MIYKQPQKCEYHIFWNNGDEWTDTRKKAFEIAKSLKSEGHEDIRIYRNYEWNEIKGIFEDGDCIYSLGQFPM